MNAQDLSINDDFLSNVVNLSVNGDIIINSTQSTFSGSVDALSLTMANNNLESFSVTGTKNGFLVEVSSNLLHTMTINGSGSNVEALVTTTSTTLDFTGNHIDTLTVDGPSIHTFSASAPNADIDLLTFASLLNVDIDTYNLNIIDSLLESATFTTTSSVYNLVTFSENNVNSLVFNDATVGNLGLLTTSSSLSMSGTNVGQVAVTGQNVTTYDLDLVNTEVNLISEQSNVAIDIQAINLTYNSFATTSLDLGATTNLEYFEALNIPLQTIHTNASTIGTMNLLTTGPSFTIDGGSATNLSLQSDTASSVTADLSSIGGGFDLINNNSPIMSFDITANRAVLTLSASTITMSNSSIINELDIDSPSGANYLFGSADITDVTILDTDFNAVTIAATNIDTLDVTSDSTNIDLQLLSTVAPTITSNAVGNISVTTNTETIDINAFFDVSVFGDALTDLVVDTSSTRQVSITSNGPTSLQMDVTANRLDLDSNSITSFTINNSSIGEMFVSSPISSLSNLGFSTILSGELTLSSDDIFSLSLSGTLPANIVVESSNLNHIDSDNGIVSYDLTSSSASLDVDGQMDELIITNPFLTSLDLLDLDLTYLRIVSNSLTNLNTQTALGQGETLMMATTGDNFDLTSKAEFLNVLTNPTFNVTIHSDNTYSTTLEILAESLTLDMPNTGVIVNDNNSLINISGIVDNFSLNTSSSDSIFVDLETSILGITSYGDSPQSIFLLGAYTYISVYIDGANINNVATNDNQMTYLTVLSAVDTSINSKATNIVYSGEETGSLSVVAYSETDLVEANSATVNATSTSFADFTLQTNNGLTDRTVTLDNINQATLNFTDDDVRIVNVTGTANDLAINGQNLVDVYTDVAVTDLDFIADALDTLDTLIIANLTVSNIDNVYSALENTGIDLTSSLSYNDIDTYLYEAQVDDLSAQEALDHARFDLIRTNYITAAFNEFDSNIYLQYMEEPTVYNQIDNQSYDTVNNYFLGYALTLGFNSEAEMLADENYTQTDIDNIKASITATLAEPALTLPSNAQIDLEVLISIEADARINADEIYALKGFTIQDDAE
jgi:hypothetical protein